MPKTAAWSDSNARFARHFGEWINTKLGGKTGYHLAKDAGISAATIYAYSKGMRSPGLHEALKLLRSVGVKSIDIDELLAFETQETA